MPTGHPQKFRVKWDAISAEIDSMSEEQSVTLIKVECGNPKENEKHEEIMKKYAIKGYPTIMVFDESGSHSEYSGERSKSGIFQFLGLDSPDSE